MTGDIFLLWPLFVSLFHSISSPVLVIDYKCVCDCPCVYVFALACLGSSWFPFVSVVLMDSSCTRKRRRGTEPENPNELRVYVPPEGLISVKYISLSAHIHKWICLFVRVYSHFNTTKHVIRHMVFILKPSTYPAYFTLTATKTMTTTMKECLT